MQKGFLSFFVILTLLGALISLKEETYKINLFENNLINKKIIKENKELEEIIFHNNLKNLIIREVKNIYSQTKSLDPKNYSNIDSIIYEFLTLNNIYTNELETRIIFDITNEILFRVIITKEIKNDKIKIREGYNVGDSL